MVGISEDQDKTSTQILLPREVVHSWVTGLDSFCGHFESFTWLHSLICWPLGCLERSIWFAPCNCEEPRGVYFHYESLLKFSASICVFLSLPNSLYFIFSMINYGHQATLSDLKVEWSRYKHMNSEVFTSKECLNYRHRLQSQHYFANLSVSAPIAQYPEIPAHVSLHDI